MTEMIIIGNKPYTNLCLDGIIDIFDANTRCGLGLANRGNGTKYDRLGLCNHMFSNLIQKRLPRDAFLKLYTGTYEKGFLAHYYDSFDKDLMPKYKEVFHAAFNPGLHNRWLSQKGCPHRFSVIPTTGLTLIMNNLLLQEKKIFIAFFSLIYDTYRRSQNTHPDLLEGCHNRSDETNILMWLHKEQLIDATLCMLEDEEVPTLNCEDLEPSEFILSALKEEYGNVVIKNG